jgi:glutamine phosphoribosylpyrophosphate amidotransferase
VLRLVEGLARDHRGATIAEYVVTDDLAAASDQALGMVSSALKDVQSRVALLAASVGVGRRGRGAVGSVARREAPLAAGFSLALNRVPR